MTRRTLTALRRALTYTEGRMAEWITGTVGLGVGLILLDPTVDTFASNPSYRLLAHWAGENVWGGLMVGCVALNVLGQPWHTSRWAPLAFWLRWVGMVGQTILFCVLASQLWIASPAATGWWTYGTLGVAAGITVLRLVVLRSIAGPGGTHDP